MTELSRYFELEEKLKFDSIKEAAEEFAQVFADEFKSKYGLHLEWSFADYNYMEGFFSYLCNMRRLVIDFSDSSNLLVFDIEVEPDDLPLKDVESAAKKYFKREMPVLIENIRDSIDCVEDCIPTSVQHLKELKDFAVKMKSGK